MPTLDESRARIIHAFELLGFRVVRQGEHISMVRDNDDGTHTPITIPGQTPIKGSTLRVICSQAGIARETFQRAYDQAAEQSVESGALISRANGPLPASDQPDTPSELPDELFDSPVPIIADVPPLEARDMPSRDFSVGDEEEGPFPYDPMDYDELDAPIEVEAVTVVSSTADTGPMAAVSGAAEPDQMPEQSMTLKLFEELTLAEVLGRLIRHPRRTWSNLRQTVFVPPALPQEVRRPGIAVEEMPRRVRQAATRVPAEPIQWRPLLPLIGMGIAFLITLVGSIALESVRGDQAAARLPVTGIIMLFGGVIMTAVTLRSTTMARLDPLPTTVPTARLTLRELAEQNASRIVLVVLALVWSTGAWLLNGSNTFTSWGVFSWFMSVLTWTAVFLERDMELGARISAFFARIADYFRQPHRLRVSATALALLVILLVGGYLRFRDLSSYPPEMTSDHVEKILDALRVYENTEGGRSVFFPNNGGRESTQMYYLAVLMAVLHIPPGLTLIVFGTAVEGMIGIVLVFWLGRTIIGPEDRQLGNLTGLIMAALVATSFWQLLLSRLGLRIILTTLDATLVFGFLARSLRYNKRIDYLITGFWLGAGMYFYQAVRMLPLVVIAGVVLALLIRARSRQAVGRYIVNFIALVVVALAVFVPLARYAYQYPESFWQRTTTRLFGDPPPNSLSGDVQALGKNLPGLADNMVRSMLMFNYQGDMSWFNGAPDGTPELDFFAGALFVIGLGVLVTRMIRRRDPVDVLIPIAILIGLFPAALAVAYSIEVPSLTRASAALPIVYLVAALPLAMILQMVAKRVPRQWARRSVYVLVVVFLVVGGIANANSYFVDAMAYYRDSTLPHRQAGQIMKGFWDSTGSEGNSFVPAFDYWWDFRALAIEAGDPHWANIIWRPNPRQNFFDLLKRNVGTKYELRPDLQLLFFMDPTDKEIEQMYKSLFPSGVEIHVAAYKPDKDFLEFVAPPVGCQWIIDNVGNVPTGCEKFAPGANSEESPVSTPTAAPQ